MANNFEDQVNRFENWLHAGPHRLEEDFFNLPDLLEHETLRQYFSRNAFKPDIIKDTVNILLDIERERTFSIIFRK